jgi:uncharacterized GH25 family protein
MSLKVKLSIAFLASMGLAAALLFFLLRGQKVEEGPLAGREVAGAPAAAGSPRAVPEKAARPALEKKAAARGKKQTKAAEETLEEEPPVEGGWTLSGRIVRDGGTAGEPGAAGAGTVPVEGAIVYLKPHPRRTALEEAPPIRPRKRTTGPDGRFELAGVPVKTWLRMEIDEPSSAYRTLSFTLKEPDGDTKKELGDIPLEPGGTLAVKLVGPRDEPIEKGKILVGRRSASAPGPLSAAGIHESRREAEEKGKGEYLLERAPLGSLFVEAEAPGYAPSEMEPAELPQKEPLVIRLQPGSQITGTVTSTGGKPVAGASLEASGAGTPGNPAKVKTDSEGRFVFNALADGNFTISATAEGYVTSQKGGVASGAAEVAFSLTPEAVFSGKVVAQGDESPIGRAKVSLRTVGGGPSFSADTDPQGVFKVRKVPAGTYTAQVDHPDFAPSSEEPREVKEGETIAGQLFHLEKGFSATGKVVDSDSQAAIPEAQVTFQLRSDEKGVNVRRTAKTDPQGGFEVKGLREGSYLLSAGAKGYFSLKSKLVEVSEKGERVFNLTLEQGSSIAGRVLDTAGNPIAAAVVRPSVAIPNGGWNQEISSLVNSLRDLNAQTDAEGRYRLEGLSAHTGYSVAASHRDYASSTVEGLNLGAKESLEDVELKLTRGGTVKGRVLDENGAGIPGANVSANLERPPGEDQPQFFFANQGGSSATTDREGGYTLAHLAAGSYGLRAQAKDRMSATRGQVTVAEERTLEGIDITLGAGEVLSGRVVDGDGNAIAGATIQVFDRDSAQGRSDAEGRFTLKGLKAGRFSVNVSKSGFEPQNLQLEVPGKETLFTLVRAGRIAGNVQAKGRESLPGFQIMATRRDASGGISSRSQSYQPDPTGKFEIEVGQGTYVLWAMVPGFAPSRSAEVAVKSGERVEGVVIDLVPGATIRGSVTAAGTGEPISGASISMTPSRDDLMNFDWGLPGATSQPDGSFVLEGVPEGTITLTATHAQYAQATVPGISVRAGGTAAARIELSAGGRIRGVVTSGGQPLSGARVNAWKSDGLTYVGKDAVTGPDGRFEIKPLPAGDYMLGVQRGGRRGGFNPRQERVTVADGQVSEVTLDEGAGIHLSGIVTQGGVGVGGGNIMAMQPEKGGNGASAEIEGSGAYSLVLPGPGSYLLMIERGGGRGGTKVEVTVPEGSTELRQDIELPAGAISGVVVDAETGEPLGGAQLVAFVAGGSSRSFASLLRAMQSQARSDDQGSFLLENLPAGSYSLKAFADGYADGRVEGLALDEGKGSVETRVALERGVDLQLRVVDQSGQPVAQAMALLRDSAGEMVFFQNPRFSNQEGLIELTGVRPGVYRATALHRSYASQSVTVRAPADGQETTITLRPGGKLQVQVVNRQSKPVEGAEVAILNDKGENVAEDGLFLAMMGGGGSSMTGSAGSLVLDQLSPGTYRAVASRGKTKSREEKLSVAEGKLESVRLTLPE